MRIQILILLVLIGMCGAGEADPKVNPAVEKAMSAALAEGEKAYAAYKAALAKASGKAIKDLEKAKVEAVKKGDMPSANDMDVKINLLKAGGLEGMLAARMNGGDSLGAGKVEAPTGLVGVGKPAWATGAGKDQYGTWADLQVAGLTQRFRWIQPGTFTMGSPQAEKNVALAMLANTPAEAFAIEVQHQVNLTQSFWLADSACTQALWQAITGSNPANFKDSPQNPVNQVSWDDCQQFLSTLNGRVSGGAFCLPSEAQWEYACRAGTTTAFSFGATITPEQVNYDGNFPFGEAAKGLYRQKTVQVKSLPPNAWGLYEMHGNVWQWCHDRFGDLSGSAERDPAGPSSGSERVFRGGGWFSAGRTCRSAIRDWGPPGTRRHDLGFRLAAPATP